MLNLNIPIAYSMIPAMFHAPLRVKHFRTLGAGVTPAQEA